MTVFMQLNINYDEKVEFTSHMQVRDSIIVQIVNYLTNI